MVTNLPVRRVDSQLQEPVLDVPSQVPNFVSAWALLRVRRKVSPSVWFQVYGLPEGNDDL